jgi:hypothetical protein
MTPRTRAILTLAALGLLVAAGTARAQAHPPTLEVTITNLTAGQVLSPPVVIAHNASFQLFRPATPASPELAMLAEDAVTGPLVAALGADPNVRAVEVGASPIPPGGSATVAIQTNGAFRHITVAGMLVTTNDAFFAVQGLEAGAGGVSTHANAYDAGSEENNEDCTYIPGPPCGNAGVRTPTSEGFVHIHPGIHGIASLPSNLFDWRNPTARVSVAFSPAGR